MILQIGMLYIQLEYISNVVENENWKRIAQGNWLFQGQKQSALLVIIPHLQKILVSDWLFSSVLFFNIRAVNY